MDEFGGGRRLEGEKGLGGGKELEGEGVKNFRGTPYKSLGGGGKELYPEQGSNKGINKEVNQEEFPPPSPAAMRRKRKPELIRHSNLRSSVSSSPSPLSETG